MANKIILKKSSVAARVPTTDDLSYGELALNYADGLLFYKTASNTIQVLNSGTSITAGDGLSLTGSSLAVDNTVVRTTGSYADPSWITGLDYSKLSGTVPTWNQNTTGTAAALTTARTLTIGDTGKAFDGSANVSWSLAEIGAYSTTNPAGYTTNTGTVTSVATGTDLTGGTITTTGTISHADSGVTAGTYNNVTVNARGHVTSGSNVAYLTGYTETDTLATVTARGASTGTLSTFSGGLSLSTADSRDKLRLWSDNQYTIGMQSGVQYGGLSDFAMTFQFNNEDDRGFWWGDTAHNTSQGAMALTTNGWLTVARGIRVGGGESDTSQPILPFEVVGTNGQLFSVTDSMTGTIFSANDISGIPSIEVLDTGLVKLAQYSGNVVLGSGTDNGVKLQVNGGISTPTMWVNQAASNFNGYNENIRLFAANNGVAVIAYGASGFSGTPWNSTLGFSDRFEIRQGDAWQLRSYSGYVEAAGSFRAPIFYDSNNTGYYWDGASTSKWNESIQDGWHTFNNYGLGITGTYDSYRLQTVFAMGSSYRMAADGLSTSNMYGLAWSHPNAGSLGGANNLNDHGLLIINNGSFQAAISSRAVFSQDVRGTLFYDYNDTGYYVDPNSTGTSGNFAGTLNAVNFNSTSDKNLKENIEPITNAIEKVKEINGVIYNFKADKTKKKHAGVIAQDVMKVLPEAVSGTKEEHYKVSYNDIVGLLIEAIKEQQKQIDELKKLLEK